MDPEDPRKDLGTLKDSYRRLRRVFRACQGRDVFSRVQSRCPKMRLGSDYGGWYVCPVGLNRESIVYSFGIGEDITFDLALIERFGLAVHAFDPTPQSLEWLKSQSLPPGFHWHPFGIGERDEEAILFKQRGAGISRTILRHADSLVDETGVTVNLYRLGTIMGMLGHSSIDLLKVDIEGAEFAVIDDILESRIPIGQICLEVHFNVPDAVSKVERMIRQLNRAGYAIFDISPSGHEYSLIRSSATKQRFSSRLSG